MRCDWTFCGAKTRQTLRHVGQRMMVAAEDSVKNCVLLYFLQTLLRYSDYTDVTIQKKDCLHTKTMILYTRYIQALLPHTHPPI